MLETKASASGHFKHICNPVHSSRVAEKWNMKVPDSGQAVTSLTRLYSTLEMTKTFTKF